MLRRVPAAGLVGVTGGFLVDLLSDVVVFFGGGLKAGCFVAGALPAVVGRFDGLDDAGVGWLEDAWPLVDA